MKQFFFTFDKIWCGKTQIPASILVRILDTDHQTLLLASYRLRVACGLVLEILGAFLITLGLFSWSPLPILMLGIFFKVCGGLFSSYFQNRSGVFLSIELQNALKNLSTHSQEISALLSHRGYSESEITAIQTLPAEVYQSELNSYNQASLLNLGIPIACGLALLANGEFGTSFVVIGLGLLSFPMGEYFFREHTFRREAQLRIGRSAQLNTYLQHIYDEHIHQMLKVNALSQLPLVLFGVRVLWNSTGQLLANFFAIVQGLTGLSGTLAFQRSRVAGVKSTEMAIHLIEILAGKDFIITTQRWQEHIRQKEILPPPKLRQQIENGVAIIDFTAKDFQHIVSLTCAIPNGGAYLLQAPSGRGKSTFLAALLHLIEHTGSFFFVDKGEWVDIHTLSRENFEKKVLFFKEENFEKSARLVDMFQEVFRITLRNLYNETVEYFGQELTNLAWNASDNLIEKEVQNIEIGSQSVFPEGMLETLKLMRTKKAETVNNICKKAGGNLATSQIFPHRVFATLSSGEKRRMMSILSLEIAAVNPDIKLIILDEPLAHLDMDSVRLQINTLKQMQEQPYAPPLLIISHIHIEELMKSLLNAELVVA
jgi:energy-coupling factor transporter ATP-binding protein EcfA2